MTSPKVRDELQHISTPLVVQVAWSTQRRRWAWFEYLDEIEDLVEQPLYGTVETRDPAVRAAVPTAPTASGPDGTVTPLSAT